jgi:uncharacterized DUF497 family protein
MLVEWDDRKARANKAKHGVSFEDAVAVLEDALSMTFRDPDHSIEESRFLTFGHDLSGRILVVAHADRGEAVRLISARRVTRAERRQYEEGKPKD